MIQNSAYSRKVILVDEQDKVIGEEALLKAHEGKGLLHRASSVFLFRKKDGEIEVLLQKRSEGKIVAAGRWANTACGNVEPGQTYQQCALSRLKIELGIEGVDLTQLTPYRYQVQCDEKFSENEITMIFAGWFDGLVQPNLDEVSQTSWVSWEKLLQAKKLDSFQFAGQKMVLSPWIQLMINDAKVAKLLENFCKGK